MKNKKIELIWVVIAILSCLGCERNNGTNTNVSFLKISPKDGDITVRTTQLGGKCECLILEMPENLLLGEVTKVIETTNSVFVSDKSSLVEFTLDGKYKRSICKSGSGPGEYLGISDFVIGPDSTTWILSRSNKAVLCFDKYGAIKQKISLDYWVSKIAFVNKNTLALYIGNEMENEGDCRLRLLNINDKTIKSTDLLIDPIRSKYLHINSVSNFSVESEQSIYFYEAFNDTVYGVRDNCVVPMYYLDLDGANIPYAFLQSPYDNVMEFFQALHKNSYAYGCNLFMQSKSGIVCSYFYSGKYHLSVITSSKEQNKDFTQIIEDVMLCDYPIDLTEHKLFPQHNGRIIIPIEADAVLGHIELNALDKHAGIFTQIKDKESTMLLIFQF